MTVIESGPQLMTREDPDVADEMQRILSDEGIRFLIAAETLNVHGLCGEEISVTVRTTSGEQKIEGSDILVAAGRVPNTAGIGLEEAGGSSGTISPEESAARAIGWFPTACSRTLHLLTSD